MSIEFSKEMSQESEKELSKEAETSIDELSEGISDMDFQTHKDAQEAIEKTPEYFQAIENTELSPEKEDGERVSRFKKALLSITAGVMLFNAVPVFGGEQHRIGAEEQQHTEIQKNFKNYEISEEAMRTMEKWGWQLSGNVLNMGEKGSYDFQTPDISRVRELKRISIFDVTAEKISFRVEYQDGSMFEFYGVNGDIVHKK